jgi:hypothetical protein
MPPFARKRATDECSNSRNTTLAGGDVAWPDGSPPHATRDQSCPLFQASRGWSDHGWSNSARRHGSHRFQTAQYSHNVATSHPFAHRMELVDPQCMPWPQLPLNWVWHVLLFDPARFVRINSGLVQWLALWAPDEPKHNLNHHRVPTHIRNIHQLSLRRPSWGCRPAGGRAGIRLWSRQRFSRYRGYPAW